MSFLLQQKMIPTMVHPSFDPFSTDLKKIRATGFDDTDFFHAFDAGFTELMREYLKAVDSSSIFTMSLHVDNISRAIGKVIEEAFEEMMDLCDGCERMVLECVQLFYMVIAELKALFPGASIALDLAKAPDEVERLDLRNYMDMDDLGWEQEVN